MRILSLFLATLAIAAVTGLADNPHWIWTDGGKTIDTNEVRYFRKKFKVTSKPAKVNLSVAAADDAVVFINGKKVASPTGYEKPVQIEITNIVKRGENVIAIRGHNATSTVPAVVLLLELKKGKESTYVVTDKSWLSSERGDSDWTQLTFNDSSWKHATSKGKHGDKPWGEVFKIPKATPAEELTVLPGFRAQLIHNSEIGEGSWICMTVDSRGRLIVSPQANDQPLLRFTVGRNGEVRRIEKMTTAPVHQAMGLLYADRSLYVSGHGPNGIGLYRLIDANLDDRFDASEVHFLKKIEGEGEHGYHAVNKGPDNMIYMMNGNHTKVLADISPNSPHKNYHEDFLLPRQWDANGHAVGILAPGGYVARRNSKTRKWELMLAGFRNSYDFDFNKDGEMFTFDSDMEWDWGLPWYRPIRIIHCIPGAEYGWRSGSAKWPEYYPDSLPATINIGIGSPTGVKFGSKSNFPDKYRHAMYALDWSYGRIFAIHLHPAGASYSADYEVLVKGKPLNLTDVEFGKDGAMYFITGGRGTQSGLYRVTYQGSTNDEEQSADELAAEKAGAEARQIRHQLESLYGHTDPKAIPTAWPYLASNDRFLRYAARIAVEWQPVAAWKDRALAETDPQAGLAALLGLARCGGKETQRDLLMALKKFPMDSLSLTQKLEKLRVIELSFIRQGKPDSDLAKLAIDKLDRLYPNDNEYMNRELSQILIYLQAPGVVTKTLALLDKAKTQEEQVHYIFYLRNMTNQWTLDQRKHYFDWFRFAREASKDEASFHNGSPYRVWTDQKKASERHPPAMLKWFKDAGRDYGDGASYSKYLANIQRDAAATLSETDRFTLRPWIQDYSAVSSFKSTKERKYVQHWTMPQLESSLGDVAHGRNFAAGKAVFNDAQCILCHRLGSDGGSVGPELSAASSKYTRRDILESILEPSKVISEQFQNTIIVKKDGDAETGRIVDVTANSIVVQPAPLYPDRVEIKKTEIAEQRPSPVSPMPEGLLDQFTKDDILNLLAYIESSGKEKAANFKPVEAAKK